MPEWTVPGYTEVRALGSGGFGRVVLARHDASGALVAIKYLHTDLLADREFTGMFRSEASVLASLDDPNIVRLYEYVESPSGAAIVMELIGGVSLRRILTCQGKTTAEAALVVLHGSLMGLAAAHRRGIVHRDYKPENVLVRGDGISKLTDFGIAARTGDRPVPAGTVLYAAPEQMTGASASPASDIYAATATFYECLTGRPPFHGESPELLLRQHQSEPVPLDCVPKSLRPLVSAGMAKEPYRRPTDASSYVTQLQKAAARAYGRRWHRRGRSHLGDAAVLLAAAWPTELPPAVQDTAVHRIRLRRRLRLEHASAIKTAIVAGVLVTGAAAGTALAATNSASERPSAAGSPAAAQSVSLQPSPTSFSSLPTAPAALAPESAGSSATVSPASAPPPVSAPAAPGSVSTEPTGPSASPALTAPSPTESLSQSGSPSPEPAASVCEPDGTGCTKGGTYPDPNALISSDYGGFKLTWSSTSVQPYSSGVPLYWTVGVTYQNIESSTLSLRCQGPVTDFSSNQEHMSGGDGDDGAVSASSTTCSEDPAWSAEVPPGGTVEAYATFHNVPWPGVAVAIQWGEAGTSAAIFPFN
ncbi:MAG: protein kinase domain-containing protein [Streptosporangiaceae bacterium]